MSELDDIKRIGAATVTTPDPAKPDAAALLRLGGWHPPFKLARQHGELVIEDADGNVQPITSEAILADLIARANVADGLLKVAREAYVLDAECDWCGGAAPVDPDRSPLSDIVHRDDCEIVLAIDALDPP
jgi:hypothetical protein